MKESVSTGLLNPGPTDEGIVIIGSDSNQQGDIRFGHWEESTGTFEPGLLASDSIEVTVSFTEAHPNGSVPLIFGDLLGGSANVSSKAIALRKPSMPVPDGLWVTGPSSGALSMKNGAILKTTTACTIYSEQAGAVLIESGSLLDATLIEIDGTVSVDSFKSILGFLREDVDTTDESSVQPPPAIETPPIHSLPTRTFNEFTAVRLKPGYYPDGLVVDYGSYLMMNGLYRFGGPGIQIMGTATLASQNSLIYLDHDAEFILDGTVATLEGPTESLSADGPLADWIGIAIMSDASEIGPMVTIRNLARCETDHAIHLPGATIEVLNSSIQSGSIVTRKLSAEDDSTINIGDLVPHPHNHLLVQ